jgi:hypothetical protein
MSLDDFDSGHAAHQFNEYWHTLAGGNTPECSQFSPIDVKACLRWIMVSKETHFDNGLDFQLTLIGASASEMAIHAKKGQFLREFTEEDCYETRKAMMVETLRSGQATFAKINMASNGEYKTNVLVGMFPFIDENERRLYAVPCPENKKLRALM